MRNEYQMKNEKAGKVKKGSALTLLMFTFCFFFCLSCDNSIDPLEGNAQIESGYGRIRISFAGGEAAAPSMARTVFPSTAFDRYAYTFTKAGEADGVELNPDYGGFFTLEVGTYTVEVQAYTGNAEPYTLAASGVSEQFYVYFGYNDPVAVRLTGVAAEGQGEFSYAITYPPGATAVISLQKWPGLNDITLSLTNSTEGNGVTETLELEAGSYLLSVLVSKNGLYAGISEAVHIYPALTTVYARNFYDDELLAFMPITSAEIIVTTPVKGAMPDTTANGTGNFTIGAVSWSPTHNSFLGGTVYTATVTLTANNRCTFTGFNSPTINGQNAVVSNNTGSSVTLSYTFPATDTRTVTDIAIKTQPDKLAYTHGDTLDLTGLAVTLTHDDASTEDVAAAGFTAKNISANPAHGNHLDHLTHNGQHVTITYGSLTPLATNILTVNPKVITFTVNSISAQTYNGSAHTPALTVRDGTATLALSTNYTAAYANNTNAGTATVTISGVGNYAGSSGSASFIINPRVITFAVDSISAQTYNGSAHTPALTVRDGTTALALSADYTVAYANNTNAGTATVTISGVGNYAGSSRNTSFTVNRAAGAAVSAPTGTSSVSTNSITINAVSAPENGQIVEYARNTTNTAPSSGWQTGTSFSGLTAGATYYIFARSAQNTNYNAGAVSSGYSVTTHKYSISLNPTTHAFTAAAYGYGAQSARSVTISNTGNQATGALTVALSGTNAGNFTLSTASIDSIAAGGDDSFTVVPHTGLSASTAAYTATVTVSGANGISATLSVSFTINRAAGEAVSAPTGTSSVTSNSVTINAVAAPENGQIVEYARNTTNTAPSSGWQEDTTFSGLTAGATYYIFARSAQNTNYNAGAASSGYSVTTHKYSISLNPTTHAFTAAAYGYGAQSTRSVTISNTGNQATGALTVALSGTNAGNFTLSTTSIDSITAGGTDSFTVVPNTGLNASTTAYTATVTVSGANGISATLSVSFTVNKAAGAAVSAPASTSSVSNTGITVNAVSAPANGQTVEYAISLSNSAPSSGWQTSRTFSGLMYGTTYYIFARSAQSANYNAGTALGLSVTTSSPIGNEADPFPLTANVWKDGSITVSGGEAWYSFYAAANTPYYVWWNGGSIGDGTKTLRIDVTAYNNKTQLFNEDYGWSDYKLNNRTITVPSGGTVYLRVTAYSSGGTGTFAIGYSTHGERPGIQPPASHTPLTANQWKDGSITVSGGEAWYSFYAAANTPYYVWWNGDSYGDGTKTLWMDVTAYDSSRNFFYDYSGWNEYGYIARTITVPSGGTVYLRVKARDSSGGTGTFAIGYSTHGERPGIQPPASHTPLTANQWKDGSITVPGGEAWYSFYAAANTPYYVWWNGDSYGDGTKTLWMDVTAYDSSRNFFYDYSGWNEYGYIARTITVPSGGTVYLRVKARDSSGGTGTFAIGYSTSSTRP